jgi:hypothetical protein
MTTIERYTFGDENQYYYEFNFHKYFVPGSGNVITTIMMTSTNMRTEKTSLIDPYIPDFIQFMANKCVEYNASYDGFHNNLVPYSFDDSANIADKVNIAIEQIKTSKQ